MVVERSGADERPGNLVPAGCTTPMDWPVTATIRLGNDDTEVVRSKDSRGLRTRPCMKCKTRMPNISNFVYHLLALA
jgi:hypothetical protein